MGGRDRLYERKEGDTMNKTILFSPLGGTDPISQANYRDASMLHICRFEHPDKVYLYLSKEMVEFEEADHRYTYCLEKLQELQGRHFEIELIERPELVDVYDYDYFYTEFSGILNDIMENEMDETDTLILNISSGTPAMKSALAVLQTISEYNCRLVQVTTPVRSMNKHDVTGYDVKLLWDCNEDNEEGAPNRCLDVSLPTLALLKKEEIIKMHVRAYDYRAALQVAQSMPTTVTGRYIDLLWMACARLGFDISKVVKYETSTGYRCLPVKSSDACKRFEYALTLQVKLWKQEYADFIRAVTPLIVDLFEQVLKEKCGFVVDQYCTPANKARKLPRRWSMQKLAGSRALDALNHAYSLGFTGRDISSDHLRVLIEEYSTDPALKNLVVSLRDVETNVRNIAAHQMESIDEEKIRNLTGQTPTAIMQGIRKLFGYTGYKIPADAWNSYDDMNDLIISFF